MVSFADAGANRVPTQIIRIFFKSLDSKRLEKQKTDQLINNLKKKRELIQSSVRTNLILHGHPVFSSSPIFDEFPSNNESFKKVSDSGICHTPVSTLRKKSKKHGQDRSKIENSQ